MYFLQTLSTSLSVIGPSWSHRTIAWNTSAIHTSHHPSASTYSLAMPSAATPASKQVIEIIVGSSGKLIFNPSSVSATEGTILRFNFMGLNHTLTQSSLADPCISSAQLDNGFHQFNPLNITGKFSIDIEVKSTKPQWFYCAQEIPKSHCHAGMVFSLNPAGKEVEFVDKAKSSSTHPLITPPPSPKYCHDTGISTSRPSNVTASSIMHRPNTTAIMPPITNAGSRIEYWLGYCFGSALLFLCL